MGKKIRPKLSKKTFPIVGIGASAGGLEAFTELLKALPVDTGMAFVLIHHLAPAQKSLTPSILSRVTQMPVEEVTAGMSVLPNHVYVIPPNRTMILVSGSLKIVSRTRSIRQPGVIDSFFQSLANQKGNQAIGVVLSGTASDGTEGLRAIKAAGGLSMAQKPASAQYPEMPKSAIASGVVDQVLLPKEISLELAKIAKNPDMAKMHEGNNAPTNLAEKALREIFYLLRTHSHIDVTNYKRSTLNRRIQRRMIAQKKKNLQEYVEFLKKDSAEVRALYSDILIHVTEFFRDPEAFGAVRKHVFPKLIKNRSPEQPIRIWVPGCATGEEVYSIAISLLEFLEQEGTRVSLQIFATDISETAIQKARTGLYPESIKSKVGKKRLERFFEKQANGYKIKKEIRDLCLFSKHDLISDPPFSKLDFISCRNVFIYFDSVLQRQVGPSFHYALLPGGFLWLGTSENPGPGSSKLFTLVNKANKIYRKETSPAPSTFRLSPRPYTPLIAPTLLATPGLLKTADHFQKEADKVTLSKYAPPAVLVNADLEILHFRGRTAPYLEPASGLPSNQLLKMVKPELFHTIQKIVQLAMQQNAPARTEGLFFKTENERRRVDIQVVPTNALAPASQRTFLIFFEEKAPLKAKTKSTATKTGKKIKYAKGFREERILQLEQDLVTSKHYQEALNEQFESTQEELTSGNEELQSTNEELQSINEELETAKEELQSSNEELTTVNDELQTRNSDLTQVNDDFSNLLNSVEIPILIIGSDHRIRRFTPKAEKFFKLIPSDIGRLISDVRSDFDVDMDAMIDGVITSLSPVEKEIKNRQNKWMRLQVRPYKTIDNKVEGAVISLVDIESLKQKVQKATKTQDYLFSILESVTTPLIVLDSQWTLKLANRIFWKHFKLSEEIIGENFIHCLGLSKNSSAQVEVLLQKLFSDQAGATHNIVDFEAESNFPSVGKRTLLLSANLIQWVGEMSAESSDSKVILLSVQDITEKKRIANEQAESKIELANQQRKLEAMFGQAPIGIALMSGPTFVFEKVNTAWTELFSPRNYLERTYVETLPELRTSPTYEYLKRTFQTGNTLDVQELKLQIENKAGVLEDRYYDFSYERVLNGEDMPYGVFCHALNVTERVQARQKAEEARAEAEAANHMKDAFLATLSHELRTPLTSILSWAQLIQRQNFDSDKLKHGIETIEQSAKTQRQLIDDLLDVSRIQSGKLSINFSEVDLCKTVALAVETVLPTAEAKNILIETDIKISTAPVWADSERVQQIVWNLLTNAIKFSNSGDKVYVRLDTFSNHEDKTKLLSIKVIDTGKGIRPEFLSRLFERFSQADNSSIRTHGGLGLGLAIVRDLVQLQGGKVYAESEGLGKGSTFTVILPMKTEQSHLNGEHQTSAEKKLQADAEPPDLSGLCVMIVEDEPKSLEVLTVALNSFGSKTIPCGSVSEALNSFEKFKPDLIVSDIAMPGEDGYSLMRKIRSSGSTIPSVALTAYATEEDIKRAKEAGFHEHLAKPCDTFKLGHEVAKLARKQK